jgi:integrase
MTVREALELVVIDYEMKGQNTVPLRAQRAHLEAGLGADTPLTKVDTPALYAHIRARLAAGAARATVNRETGLLRRAWALAERSVNGDARAELVALRPYAPRLREDNARQGFVEPDEIAKICSHMPEAYADAVRFAAETGWRRGEVLTLTWAEVDADAVRLRPERTKARDGRMFPLTPVLREILTRRHVARCADAAYVFHLEGHPLPGFYHHWKRACRLAKLPNFRIHDLRRSAARRLERAGVPRSVMMRLVGWRTEAMLRRYCIVAEADLKVALDRLSPPKKELEE